MDWWEAGLIILAVVLNFLWLFESNEKDKAEKKALMAESRLDEARANIHKQYTDGYYKGREDMVAELATRIEVEMLKK